jgi:hypothetical protein
MESETTPREISQPFFTHTAQLPRGSCGANAYYSVSAVVSRDAITGEVIQSAASEELMLPPSCAALEITLEPFWVYGVDDGDFCTIFTDCRDDYEAYGWVAINGGVFSWNDHCDPGFGEGCLSSAPSYTAVLEASEHDWANMWLNSGTGWHRGNNVIRVPIRDGEALNLSFILWDHDDRSDDDVWCMARVAQMAEARSAADWLTFDQELVWDGNERGGSISSNDCIIRFRARGMLAAP